MSQEHPELIFVKGPQAGQRVVLNRPRLVLGRGGTADVLLSEEHVSREQMRYELIPQGPTLENLSDRGTHVNGKRYKKGKRLLLETGDLIGAGRDTEVLFVAAGDDPDSALAMYQAGAETRKNAFGKKPLPAPAAAPAGPAPVVAEPAPAEAKGEPEASPTGGKPGPAKRPSEMTSGERHDAQTSARRRKIAIILAAYGGALVLIGVFLKIVLGGGSREEYPTVPELTRRQIDEAMADIPDRTPDLRLARERLGEAVGLYQPHHLEPVTLYRCVLAFKDSLACGGVNFFVGEKGPEYERMSLDALGRMIEVLWQMYRNAILYEKAGDWGKAERAFRELLTLLSAEKDPEKNMIFQNVQAHHKRVKYYQAK